MKPKHFKEETKTLSAPTELAGDSVKDLPVFSDGETCVSCWAVSFVERMHILTTGEVYVGVLSGKTQPPIWIDDENPFRKSGETGRFSVFCKEACDVLCEVGKTLIREISLREKRRVLYTGLVLSLLIGILSPVIGLFAAFVATILKEAWDSYGKGKISVTDMLLCIIGSLLALVGSIPFHNLIF